MASADVSSYWTDDLEFKKPSQLTPAQKKALVGLEVVEKKDGKTVKPRFAKTEALQQLGRLLGMYDDDSGDEGKGMIINISLGQQVNIGIGGNPGERVTEIEIGHLRIAPSQSQ